MRAVNAALAAIDTVADYDQFLNAQLQTESNYSLEVLTTPELFVKDLPLFEDQLGHICFAQVSSSNASRFSNLTAIEQVYGEHYLSSKDKSDQLILSKLHSGIEPPWLGIKMFCPHTRRDCISCTTTILSMKHFFPLECGDCYILICYAARPV